MIFSAAAFAQPGSEIYLFDLHERKETVSIENGKNITNHKGYDTQPFFHFSEPLYADTLAREFNLIEPENAMKWGAIRPAQARMMAG